MSNDDSSAADSGPEFSAGLGPAPHMTSDDACRFTVWWTRKKATCTTPRQAALAAWCEASRVAAETERARWVADARSTINAQIDAALVRPNVGAKAPT